jgi:hypothetical protein
MSSDTDDLDMTRSREEQLKSLIERDIDDEITELATRALRYCQEGST